MGNPYRATLNDLIKWFKEEDMSFDKPIEFHTINSGGPLTVAGTYNGSKKQPCVDLE